VPKLLEWQWQEVSKQLGLRQEVSKLLERQEVPKLLEWQDVSKLCGAARLSLLRAACVSTLWIGC
jgi:hypothetical protein